MDVEEPVQLWRTPRYTYENPGELELLALAAELFEAMSPIARRAALVWLEDRYVRRVRSARPAGQALVADALPPDLYVDMTERPGELRC